MPWIREDDLKNIQAQADIVDIVSSYIPVEKKGKNYKAICPFHEDHDPSMTINTEKQIYKCFVCGEGGNVFKFVSKMENISFPQAVAKVADMIHYPLHMALPVKNEIKPKYAAEYDILNEYIRFLKYELDSQDGQQARNYCQNRKLTPEIRQMFEIGYAPLSQASLHFLKAKQVSQEKMQELGLSYGSQRAFFENRLMIPIHDTQGNPVGFTARRLSSNEEEPKYINTAQTLLYDKSRLIFNYHRAKAVCSKAGRVILVEGAMDVIGLAKAGIQEGIANLGTACTDEQIQLIRSLHTPVIVCYDADRAGRDACYKFARKAAAARIPFTIAKPAAGKDPDEVFNQYGAQEVQKMVEKTITYVEFLFEYLPDRYNLDNYQDKTEAAGLLDEAIRTTAREYEKPVFYQRLMELTGFDYAALQPKQRLKRKDNDKKPKPPAHLPSLNSGMVNAQHSVLRIMLESKQASQRFQEEIGFFQDPLCDALSFYIYDIYRSKDQMDSMELLSSISEEDVRQLLMDILEHVVLPADYTLAFEDCLKKMQDCMLQEEIEKINKEIAGLSDPVQKAKLAVDKQALICKRHTIRTRKEG